MGFLCCGAERDYERLLRQLKKKKPGKQLVEIFSEFAKLLSQGHLFLETVSDTVCPASMDIKTIDFWRSLHRVTVASQWGIGLAKYSVSSYKGKVFKQEIQYWGDARIPVKCKRLCDRCFFFTPSSFLHFSSHHCN